MNPRQTAFAHEYVVDHNGAKAAIRAGYAPGRAKQTARDLLRRPDVAQLVERLDAERREELGIDAKWIIRKLVEVVEKSMEGAPKVTRDGQPIRVIVDGEEILVREWSPSGANKALETLAKHLGLLVERTQIEVSGEVVYTLQLDRVLEDDGDG